VEGDRKTMGFVAYLLNQVQHRRMVVERNRLIFPAQDEQNFLLFGDAGEGLVDDCSPSKVPAA
jgi:hypothetical protein